MNGDSHTSHSPRLAFRAVEPTSGFGIADDLFLHRVPLERTFEPVGNVAEMAERDGPMPNFDVAKRPLPRAHAMQEIAEDAALATIALDENVRRLLFLRVVSALGKFAV